MKQVTRDHDQLRLLLQQIVDGALEDFRDVNLTLVRALRRLPVELAEPEVQVGEVRELHWFGSSTIEFSVSVCMVMPAEPSPDPLKLIFIVPLTVPSTIAPREIENT